MARLSSGVLPWGQVCRHLAYNRLVLTAEGGAKPKLSGLTASMGDPAIDEPTNISFDVGTLFLQSVTLGPGPGDCGEVDDWGWDGKAFQIISQGVTHTCRGLKPSDWATRFRSRGR